MIFEFPDNLNSSQSQMPDKQGKDWQQDVKFLHYFPKNKVFGREEQEITKNIKDIEMHYKVFVQVIKQKVSEMVSQLLIDEQGTLNIIPKKANIDLKRAIQPKLEKLQKKTEKAIVGVLNEKFFKVEKQEQEVVDPQKEIPVSMPEKLNIYDREIDYEYDDYDDDYEKL